MVACHDDDQLVRQVRPRLACDARDLDREPLEPAQGAQRLGQLILPSALLGLRGLIERRDALGVLARVGGLEIAALVGVILGSAARRLPVFVDGFITTAAALVASELCPASRNYLIAAHRSVERGHTAALEHLELEPLLALDMRLGEGTGAALALPIVDAALALLDEMATFEDAGVSGASSTALVTGC